MPADPKRKFQRFTSLENLRRPYEQHWESIAEVMLPRKRGMRTKPPEGSKLTDSQYDMTPTEAGERLALFLHGALMSTAYPFFGLEMRNRRLMDTKAIADWMEECADLMLGAYSQSNWDAESPEALIDSVFFGTSGPLFQEERPITMPGQQFGGLHFTAMPLAECFVAENNLGQIDTCYRKYSLSADSVVQLWPNTCSDSVKSLARNNPFDPVNLLLTIEPRPNPNRERDAFSWEMPYECCYIELDRQILLEEKGFREFPAPTSRWSKANSDPVYGRGRGDTAYPDVRTLNEATRYELMSWPLNLFPPYMRDAGFAGGVRWLPGAEHVVSGKNLTMSPPIQPLYNGAKWDVAQLKKEEYRESVRRAFFWHLTELPEKGPQMTAREVQIRLRIMQRALGVDPGRIKSELMEPAIGRSFNLMLHGGALPPPPDELMQAAGEDGAAIDIVYKGPLAMAQRSDDTLAIESQVEYVLSVFERTADPASLDTLDLDEAAWARGETSSVPSKIMRGKDQVYENRQRRAQEQAEAAAREERTQMADEMLKNAQASKVQNETAAAEGEA